MLYWPTYANMTFRCLHLCSAIEVSSCETWRLKSTVEKRLFEPVQASYHRFSVGKDERLLSFSFVSTPIAIRYKHLEGFHQLSDSLLRPNSEQFLRKRLDSLQTMKNMLLLLSRSPLRLQKSSARLEAALEASYAAVAWLRISNRLAA